MIFLVSRDFQEPPMIQPSMIRRHLVFCILMVAGLPNNGQAQEMKKEAPLRLLLSEVQPGTMSSEHYCMLVFDDHRFHAEKAVRSNGKERERKIYEGALSDADWNTLDGILENEDLRKLNVKQEYVPLAMQGVHPFAISVRRGAQFQNLEFIDDSSRKPYDAQLKPLFQWWKSTRSRRMAISEAQADNRCALDSSHGVFSY
jgi:hypothetical protein